MKGVFLFLLLAGCASQQVDYFQKAMETGDASYCAKITGNTADECYRTLAAIKNDASLCASVADTASREDCYLVNAANNKRPAVCNYITDAQKRDFCMNKSAS